MILPQALLFVEWSVNSFLRIRIFCFKWKDRKMLHFVELWRILDIILTESEDRYESGFYCCYNK